MEYQQEQQGSASFSRKLSMKHAYDGVFSNPGKLGNHSKVEDYREIFSGSQKCSIPVLDVPELNEVKVNVDVTPSSRVDYSKIFGGFGDADCGVSFEELLAKPKQVTRTKGEARVLSGQSKEKVVSSSEAALESFHGVKQFSMSYNKTNPGSKNGSNGLTHIAELHAVPGYTCLIDENVGSSKAEYGKPVARDDSKLNVKVEELISRDRARRKVVSGPQPSVAAENISRSNADFRRKSSRNKSISNDMSFDAFGFGIGGSPSSASPVSKLASNAGNNKHVSSRSNFGAVGSDFSVGKPGSYSPPSLDEEVDSSSIAATSAAAVRKAIEEAQLKIKIAKQLMERKREGFQNRAKSSSKNGLKAKGKPEVATAEKRNGFAVTEAQEMCEKKNTSGQAFATIADHNLMKMREAMHVKSEKESPIHKSSVEQRHCSKSNSTTEDCIGKEIDHQKATGECFEPAIPNELSATQLQFEQVGNEKKMTVSAKESEMDQKMAGEERFQDSKGSDNTSEAFEQVLEVGNVQVDLNPTEQAFEGMGPDDVKSAQEFPDQLEHKEETQVIPSPTEAEQTREASFEPDNREKELETFHEINDNAEIEIKQFEDLKGSNGTHEWTNVENIQRQAESQVELENFMDAAPLNEENMGGLDEILGEKENHKVYAPLNEENMSGLDEILGEKGNHKVYAPLNEESMGGLDEILGEKENHKVYAPLNEETMGGLDEILGEENHKVYAPLNEESMGGLDEILGEKENHKVYAPLNEENMGGLDEILGEKENHKVELQETVECERMSEVDCRKEVGIDACSLQEPLDGEKSSNVHVQEIAETKLDEIPCKDGNESPFTEDVLIEGNEEQEETEDSDNMLQRNYEMNEDENKQVNNLEGIVGLCSEICQRVEGDENLEAADDVNKDDNEFVVSSDKEYTDEVWEVSELHTIEENGISEVYFPTEETIESEAVEANESEAQERFEDAELDPDEKMEYASEAHAGDGWVHLGETDVNLADIENNATEYNHDKHVEEMPQYLDENGKDAKESMVCPNDIKQEMDFVSQTEKCLDTGIESTACNNLEEDSKCSSEGDNNRDGSECKIVNDDDKSSGEEIYEDNKMDEEVGPQTCKLEEKQQNAEMSLEEIIHSSNKDEYKSNKAEESKPDDHLQREVEVEIKQHKKNEETREREIEKERERLAVERAIREFRERAFAEAREKAAAEKAAAEAQQRQAEARQRLEKASAEAKKSASEKASMEAKLKAQRAAVERATAEARERFLEKALSEKAASKARIQAEKFSTASRDEYKGTGPSSSSRNSSSSNQDGPISIIRVSEANGESDQRCKARFERHQRTAERAAKALAEKNMRDLQAQKEQAERNRIAEMLDAEVKRWSSGKERNLRALLSTLQYILGPDSGWQPIPLTDLISTSSVKKAYRKATLCVHPDKLQQRGATIHQKYTCEKVFDLLKEAWNKFSAEER